LKDLDKQSKEEQKSILKEFVERVKEANLMKNIPGK